MISDSIVLRLKPLSVSFTYFRVSFLASWDRKLADLAEADPPPFPSPLCPPWRAPAQWSSAPCQASPPWVSPLPLFLLSLAVSVLCAGLCGLCFGALALCSPYPISYPCVTPASSFLRRRPSAWTGLRWRELGPVERRREQGRRGVTSGGKEECEKGERGRGRGRVVVLAWGRWVRSMGMLKMRKQMD